MLSVDILKTALTALCNKKAIDCSAIKIEELTVLSEYFVLATATSSTHVRALADEVDYQLSLVGVYPHHVEGKGSGWYLLDYGSVIIHIFTREAREFYNLDSMWADGEIVDITDFIDSEKESN